jgi:hypothetical protein
VDTLKQSILCLLQNLNIHADLLDHSNMCTKTDLAREREENVARQQIPIMLEMFSALLELAKKLPIYLLKTGVADWFTLIRITDCIALSIQKDSI